MAQTFYIESDEEIISVISYLRKSLEEENVFIFPKRALVLQSIINLRLLKREAEKFKKKIIIVSQDEIGRMLAEKADIETHDYQEDFVEKENHIELSFDQSSQMKQEQMVSEALPEEKERLPLVASYAIGSDSFHTNHDSEKKPSAISPSSVPVPSKKLSFPVRNASPEKLTYLNSKRSDISAPVNPSRPTFISQIPSVPLPNDESFHTSVQKNNDRLKNFYANTSRDTRTPLSREEKSVSPIVVGNNARMFFFVLGGVSILSLVLVGLFFFLPKAEVHVTPYKISQTSDKEFESKVDGGDSMIPVRIIEKEKEVSVSVSTTGKSGGSDQKSHGTVTLLNNFSADSQSLVATTRLETSDGKIFRLVSGVVVPGMTGEAGTINTEVIADQSGEEYNIDAKTKFTIPGFKGSAKYEKFSALSTKGMTGGGKSGISDVFVVTKLDQDTVLREAFAKAKEDFLNEVRDTIDTGEKILDEKIDVSIVTPAQLLSVGMVANTLEYQGTFKIKAFVFSEKMVKEKIESMSIENIKSISFHPVSSNITYDDSFLDFASGTARIKAHALVTMESSINIEKLRAMISGKDMKSIEAVLGDFPEMKSIRVIFYPEWFVQRIPKIQDRVSLIIDPGEDQ